MFLQILTARILGLPGWWYGRGLAMVTARLRGAVGALSSRIGIRVWATHLFVPMYGDTSLAGRVISFFIRLFSVLARAFGVAAYAVLMVAAFVAYLTLPILIVIGIFYHGSVLLP
ncbi:hypothetical protein FJZ23_03110 [Candidatus Parcubacteria bacterium]|nr:hypothetical protein [Candidatus Parcubacteria bacterium]